MARGKEIVFGHIHNVQIGFLLSGPDAQDPFLNYMCAQGMEENVKKLKKLLTNEVKVSIINISVMITDFETKK